MDLSATLISLMPAVITAIGLMAFIDIIESIWRGFEEADRICRELEEREQ